MIPAIVELDKYAPYILLSYAATALIFGVLILYLAYRNASVRRRLEDAERRRAEAADHASAGAPGMVAERPTPRSLEHEGS